MASTAAQQSATAGLSPSNGNDTPRQSQSQHIAFVSTHFRSHFRPMLFTALSMARQYPHIFATIYAASEVLAIVDEERALFEPTNDETNSQYSASSKNSMHQRVRVVGLDRAETEGCSDTKGQEESLHSVATLDDDIACADWSTAFQVIYSELPRHIQRFWKRRRRSQSSEAIDGSQKCSQCNCMGEASYGPLPQHGCSSHARSNSEEADSPFEQRPAALIFDFLLDIPTLLRQTNWSAECRAFAPQLVGFSPGPVAWTLRRLTGSDIRDKLDEVERTLQSQREGRVSRDAAHADIVGIFTRTSGAIVDIEGCFKCYDYELLPQLGSMRFDWIRIYLVYKAVRCLFECDSVMFSTSPEFEPGVDELVQRALQKPVFQIGPQLPPRWWLDFAPDHFRFVGPDDTEVDVRIKNFLDQCLELHGANSVLYISFGTVYSMETRPDMIESLVEALLEFNKSRKRVLPFVFATPTTSDMIPGATRILVERSGLGLFCAFAPQHYILRHRATGWFLTHGGANGVHEAIVNRVPLLFWPATTDQPVTAAQMSVNKECGLELIQVRTGPSTGQATLRGVRHQGGSRESIIAELLSIFEVLTAACNDDSAGKDASRVRANVERLATQVYRSQHDEDGHCRRALDSFVADLARDPL